MEDQVGDYLKQLAAKLELISLTFGYIFTSFLQSPTYSIFEPHNEFF